MATATFRFYGSLNDFLPGSRKQTAFVWSFLQRMSIKDTIESIGVPHPEIGLLLVNSQPVDFAYRVGQDDYVSAYPPFYQLDAASVSRVQPPPLPEFRFVLDTHLGKLATYLRMIGFDTLYRNDYADPELARISSQENRLLLTRDRGLLMHRLVTYGYYVRHIEPQRQLREIIQRFGLQPHLAPFQRCLHCNGRLQPVAKETVLDQLPPLVKEGQNTFWHCPNCGKVYWEGTHFQHMQQFINGLVNELSA